MATTWTVERYEALCEAIATGALETEYDGKKIKFRSLRDMNAIKREAERALGLSTTGSNTHYPTWRDGVQ